MGKSTEKELNKFIREQLEEIEDIKEEGEKFLKENDKEIIELSKIILSQLGGKPSCSSIAALHVAIKAVCVQSDIPLRVAASLGALAMNTFTIENPKSFH